MQLNEPKGVTTGKSQINALARLGRALSNGVAVFGLLTGGSASAQLAVSESGTPAYSVPISVPPGIAGMSPNLGLSFSGAGVNGPVGYGWSIQGVSLITRCPQSRAIDGFSRGVTYSVDDKLCLDGQRLIQTDAAGTVVNGGVTNPSLANPFQSGDSQGSSPSSFREFRTEKDTFVRVRAYGSSGAAANGPAYFKVWTKSGQIYEYGNNGNAAANSAINVQGSSVVAAWAVSRISDTLGNYIDFQYEQRDVAWGSGPTASAAPGHEWNLLEIRYTGTPTQAPANKVVFSYDDRPTSAATTGPAQDRGEAYALGSKNVSIRRLSSIRTYVNSPNPGTLGPAGSAVKVKTLKLTYDNGPVTNRSRVKQITECAGAAETACLPPTIFNYAPGGDSAYAPLAAFNQKTLPLLNATTGNVGVLVGDFNGDGLTDFIRWSDTPDQNQLYLSQGDGTFSLVPNGTSANQFNITDQNLFKSTGACYNSIASDFNGDGLTDILRFSSCPASPNTYLYINQGGGSFSRTTVTVPLASANSAITHDCLNGAPREYPNCADDHPVTNKWSAGATFYLLDVNGDGFPDIITTILPAGYELQQGDWIECASEGGTCNFGGTKRVRYGTLASNVIALVSGPVACSNAVFGDPIPGTVKTCWFDGLNSPIPADPCETSVCTHVYLGSASGVFTETVTNLAHHSVYSPPRGYSPSMPMSNADLDGDGLADLTYVSTDYWEKNAGWISRGDGNFDPATGGAIYCSYVMDFNGDGRSDCLAAAPSFGNYLSAGGSGPGYSLGPVGNFNLTSEVLVSTVSQSNGTLTAGIAALDLDGDGRADLLRWKDDPTQNVAFLSNGDGTFRAATNFNLNTAARALSGSNGLTSFVIGDFSGHGQPEILRMKSQPSGLAESTTNQLYVKVDSTPADILTSVVSPNGLTTTLTWVPLTNSASGSLGARYTSDRGVTGFAASYPKIDIAPPSYVVATSEADTGVGSSTLLTQYSYKGLKAAFDGRGARGFRETRRQSNAPDGSYLTVVTQYLQDHPYIGVASSSQTYAGTLASPGSLLSQTTNIYCDKTEPKTAEATATVARPCPVSAKVQRPYLLSSLEEGWDPVSHAALPSVTTTNSFNDNLDPTTIDVTTSGTVTTLGFDQKFTKTTKNNYLPDNTAGDAWILGRLQQATQTNAAPNDLSRIITTAGGAPGAGSTQGNGSTQSATLSNLSFGSVTSATSSTLAATLINTGALPLTMTVPSAASVSGAGFTFTSTNCGTALAAYSTCAISVTFTPPSSSSFSGSLTVATSTGPLTGSLSGSGVAPSVIFQPGSTNWGVVGAASDSGDWTQIRNNSAVPVLITAHSVASGPAGVWSWQGAAGYCVPGTTVLQPGQSCPTFFGTSNLAVPGSYSAVDQISYQVVGGNGSTFTAQQSYSFSIATTTANSTGLAFGNATVNTTTGSQSFVLTNNAINGGALKNLSIAMTGSQPGNFPFSHNCGTALAAGASCAVTVAFNPTSVANGLNAAVQIQGGYSRMLAGTDSGLTQYTGVNVTVPVTGNGAAPPNPTLSSTPTRFDGTTDTNTSPIGTFYISFTAPANGLSVTTTYGYIIAGTNTCTGTQMASCSFQWTTPANKASGSGTVTVSASNGANTLSLPVTRTYGGAPDSSIATLTSPASQSIPPTWFGGGVQSVSVTYRNDGTLPLSLSTPALAAPLSVTANSCSNVASGASCSMTVSLATNIGGLNQSQAFTPSGANSGPGQTSVSWSVYTAIPRWSTTSLNMGSVTVGSSTSQGIVLFNDGNAAYNWAANSAVANLPAGYSFNTGACANVPPGGGSCAVTVTFTPPGVGTYGGGNLYMLAASQVPNTLSVTGVGSTAAPPNPTLSSTPTRFDGTTDTNTSPIGTFYISFTAPANGLSVTTTYGYIIAGTNTCTGTQMASCSFQWTTPANKASGSGTVTVSASNGANTLTLPVTRTYAP